MTLTKVEIADSLIQKFDLTKREAKDLVEGAPKVVKEQCSKQEAEDIKKKIEEQGAKVTLK